jgi:hypothetical protein
MVKQAVSVMNGPQPTSYLKRRDLFWSRHKSIAIFATTSARGQCAERAILGQRHLKRLTIFAYSALLQHVELLACVRLVCGNHSWSFCSERIAKKLLYSIKPDRFRLLLSAA